jgi:hypothetical protein
LKKLLLNNKSNIQIFLSNFINLIINYNQINSSLIKICYLLYQFHDDSFNSFYEYIFKSLPNLDHIDDFRIFLKFIEKIPNDFNQYSKYFPLIIESVFIKYSKEHSITKVNLFSDFFTFLSPYFQTNSSIMRLILNDQHFFIYLNGLTSKDFIRNNSNLLYVISIT